MGMPWFAMISDKNIRMNLNIMEKKLLTFFNMVFFKGSSLLEICFYLSYHGSAMVCHDK